MRFPTLLVHKQLTERRKKQRHDEFQTILRFLFPAPEIYSSLMRDNDAAAGLCLSVEIHKNMRIIPEFAIFICPTRPNSLTSCGKTRDHKATDKDTLVHQDDVGSRMKATAGYIFRKLGREPRLLNPSYCLISPHHRIIKNYTLPHLYTPKHML